MLPCADHFEDLIGDLTRRAVGRDANKARNALHPLALVRGISTGAEIERLGRFLIAERRDVLQAQRLAGGWRDRPADYLRHLGSYPGLEHRVRSRLDPAQQLGTRNVEAEDGRRVARVGGPEPVGGRLQRSSRVRQLECTHDPPPIVWMHRSGRGWVAL